MGKNNRRRRAQKNKTKKRKSLLKKSKKLATRAQNVGSSSLSFQELPNFMSGRSDEEAREIRLSMAESARSKYEFSMGELQEFLVKFDSMQTLGMLASYMLSIGVGEDGIAQSQNTASGVSQAHVEYLQALILMIPVEELAFDPVTPDKFQSLVDQLDVLFTAASFRDIDVLNDSVIDPEVVLMQTLMRSHTRVVRNWGFHEQVKSISRELYSEFSENDLVSSSFLPNEVIAVFEFILKLTETKSTTRMVKLRNVFDSDNTSIILDRYYALYGIPRDSLGEFKQWVESKSIKKNQLLELLVSYSDLFIGEQFILDPQEISDSINLELQKTIDIITAFSLKSGELKSKNVDYFHLDNPVWYRPIILNRDKRFYCALPQTFFSNIFHAIDKQFESEFGAKISQRRSEYLESKICQIVQDRFETGRIVQGMKWNDSGRQYETDVVVSFDSYLFILEAKSGTVTHPALRGAPERLRRHIKDLLVDPNEQSLRLKRKIERIQSGEEIDEGFCSDLPGPIANLRRIVRVSITLDDFATLQTNVNSLKKTGWVPEDYIPCPTITLADFETLFDLLDSDIHLTHYLDTRQEIEERIPYLGDELDLMGFYLESMFEIGKLDENQQLVLTGASSEIDHYYSSMDAGATVVKPKPRTNSFFSRVLRQLMIRQTDRWLEIGVALCRFSPEDQKILSRKIFQCGRNVKRAPRARELNNQIVLLPGPHSKYALCVSVHNNENRDLRDTYFNAACHHGFEADHVEFSIVIEINIDTSNQAYERLALVCRPVGA